MPPLQQIHKQVVVVGDPMTGKTRLAHHISTGEFPAEDRVTNAPYDRYDGVKVKVRGYAEVELCVFDTSGMEHFDHYQLRPAAYQEIDAVIMVFSLEDANSLENIQERWNNEVTRFCGKKNIPKILVGTYFDSKTVPSYSYGAGVARSIGASYFECSVRGEGFGIRELFETSAWLAMNKELVVQRMKRQQTKARFSLGRLFGWNRVSLLPVPPMAFFDKTWLLNCEERNYKKQRKKNKKEKGMSSRTSIEDLGMDSLLSISYYLRTPDLGRLALVCKTFLYLTQEKQCWKGRVKDVVRHFEDHVRREAAKNQNQ
eukprot:Lithocolla_globosa_v1_NODE_6651_length_1055_cov_6.240000.p1 type:complete len:314 gc:universal NODE_6651_length_1055_cov_6.240000:973-32(-)